jgi:dTDP-4-amino-4,6-dideoxygalactose transaminase
MARAAAALLEATRAAAEEAVEGRRAAAEFFLRRLPPRGSVQRVLPIADGLPGYLRLALRIPGIGAELGRSEPARRLGVAAGYPRPLAELPVIKSRLVGEQRSWPGAVELVRDLVTLPTHALVSGADRERVVRLLDVTRPESISIACVSPIIATGAEPDRVESQIVR